MNLGEAIQTEIIQPNYMAEVDGFVKSRMRWRQTGVCMETISKLALGASSVLSFASYAYSDLRLGFFSGTVSTISLVCFQFATFSFRESKRSTEHLNKMLLDQHLRPLPQLSLKDSPKSEENKI